MGSMTRRLLGLALAGVLVLFAPTVALAQQYPPFGGGTTTTTTPAGQPGEAEPDDDGEVGGGSEERDDGAVAGGSQEQGGSGTGSGGGVLGSLAKTGAGIATLTLVGLASLAVGMVFVRRGRARAA